MAGISGTSTGTWGGRGHNARTTVQRTFLGKEFNQVTLCFLLIC